MTETTPSPLGNVITIDDERIKNHLDRVVRGSVEETLNALLDAEADRLCNAQRYERSEARRDTRAGHYERKLQTKAGEVRLRIPKLRQQTFETAIIERYRRRESSVERRSSRCVWQESRYAAWRISPRRCGARGCHRRRCQSLTRRSMGRSRLGAIDRSKARQSDPTGGSTHRSAEEPTILLRQQVTSIRPAERRHS
jgi:mutator family transposase